MLIAKNGFRYRKNMRLCLYIIRFILIIQEIQSVSFRGDGYVELTSQPLRSDSSFGFSFATLASEGLLLLSTFQGQTNGELVRSLFSLSLSFLFSFLVHVFSLSPSHSHSLPFVCLTFSPSFWSMAGLIFPVCLAGGVKGVIGPLFRVYKAPSTTI